MTPTADHPVVVHGRGLQGCPKNTPSGSERDGLDAAKLISKPAAKESPDQCAKIVHRYLNVS